jgi:hypothetical protein
MPRMSLSTALPFTLRRSQDVVGHDSSARTTERVHGLLRVERDTMILQWQVSRTVQHVGWRQGWESRTDEETEPVQEVEIPMSALSGAEVRWSWWRWPPGYRLVLTGADLRAFESIRGLDGFRRSHPAQLELGVRHSDHLAAREFAGELELAVAERALRAAEGAPRLASGEEGAP